MSASVELVISDDSIFLERLFIHCGLPKPEYHALKTMCKGLLITLVRSSNCCTPNLTPMKVNGKSPWICNDHQLISNNKFYGANVPVNKQRTYFFYQWVQRFFRKLIWKLPSYKPRLTTSIFLTVINTPFALYMYNFLRFCFHLLLPLFNSPSVLLLLVFLMMILTKII